MNTMIIYSSRYGCTKDCALQLQQGLSGSTVLVTIDQVKSAAVSVDNVDTVILGSSVYVGAISKEMKTFCNDQIDILMKKKVGIFLCCALPAELDQYLSKNFPAALLGHAVIVKEIGGEARIEKMKMMDRVITKMVMKGSYEDLKISPERIREFLEAIEA